MNSNFVLLGISTCNSLKSKQLYLFFKAAFAVLSVSFLMMFGSCAETDITQKEIVVDNIYKISVPEFLSKATSLHEDASFQYQNFLKEFYIIVIHEDIAEVTATFADSAVSTMYSNDLDGYSKLLLDNFYTSVEPSYDSGVKDTIINGQIAKVIEIDGKIDNLEIAYMLAFIQGKNNYYQVMTWTTLAKKSENEAAMRKILYTVKEL